MIPFVADRFVFVEMSSVPATSAVPRSTALVVEPDPMNIDAVRVSEICESVRPVMSDMLPVVITVPDAFGNVYVLSPDKSVISNIP